MPSHSNAATVPGFFYGTAWKQDDTCAHTLRALEAGFRAIDTANQPKYYNEGAVGDAILRFLAKPENQRADLFVQTKFTFGKDHDQSPPYDPAAPFAEQVSTSFANSLAHLKLAYVDSYVLHTPSSRGSIGSDDIAVWSEMEALFRAGKVRHLGISNIAPHQLAELCQAVATPPHFVQNLPLRYAGWDSATRDFCKKNNIIYQAYGLLRAKNQGQPLPAIAEIAKRLGCTYEQTIFSFARQLGMVCLTGTCNPAHMQEALAVAGENFVLGEADVQRILAVSR